MNIPQNQSSKSESTKQAFGPLSINDCLRNQTAHRQKNILGIIHILNIHYETDAHGGGWVSKALLHREVNTYLKDLYNEPFELESQAFRNLLKYMKNQRIVDHKFLDRKRRAKGADKRGYSVYKVSDKFHSAVSEQNNVSPLEKRAMNKLFELVIKHQPSNHGNNTAELIGMNLRTEKAQDEAKKEIEEYVKQKNKDGTAIKEDDLEVSEVFTRTPWPLETLYRMTLIDGAAKDVKFNLNNAVDMKIFGPLNIFHQGDIPNTRTVAELLAYRLIFEGHRILLEDFKKRGCDTPFLITTKINPEHDAPIGEMFADDTIIRSKIHGDDSFESLYSPVSRSIEEINKCLDRDALVLNMRTYFNGNRYRDRKEYMKFSPPPETGTPEGVALIDNMFEKLAKLTYAWCMVRVLMMGKQFTKTYAINLNEKQSHGYLHQDVKSGREVKDDIEEIYKCAIGGYHLALERDIAPETHYNFQFMRPRFEVHIYQKFIRFRHDEFKIFLPDCCANNSDDAPL